MRKTLAILMVSAALGGLASLTAAPSALAQNQPPADQAAGDALAQMLLTEAQVTNYIAAQPEMSKLLEEAPQDENAAPDPKFMAKLEALAKKYKFANYDEFDTIAGNIALVLDGVDPKTKKYVGTEAAVKQQIAEIQANKQMAPADKKQQIEDLREELKSITPIKFKPNIDLVLKYYDQLAGEEGQKT